MKLSSCFASTAALSITSTAIVILYYNAVLLKRRFPKIGIGPTRETVFEFLHKSDNSCSVVLSGNIEAISKLNRHPIEITDEKVYQRSKQGCWNIINYYSFNTDWESISAEEKDYPIAFSILAHTNTEQLLILLAEIYSPQNAYCIHVDLKAPIKMQETMELVQQCFPNVYVASKREDVVYASFWRLQADINCMTDLLNSPINWRHLINLCGQDFPIKTHLQIVEALKELNGKNSIARHVPNKYYFTKRTLKSHKIVKVKNRFGKITKEVKATNKFKSRPPYHMKVWKNLAYNAYSRKFLHWVIFESEKAKALLDWSRDTLTPDEHYWGMLDALEEAPDRTEFPQKRPYTPYVIWQSGNLKCRGYIRHFSCVFGAGNVKEILRKKNLFANKFDISWDSLPLACIKKWLQQRKRLL